MQLLLLLCANILLTLETLVEQNLRLESTALTFNYNLNALSLTVANHAIGKYLAYQE